MFYVKSNFSDQLHPWTFFQNTAQSTDKAVLYYIFQSLSFLSLWTSDHIPPFPITYIQNVFYSLTHSQAMFIYYIYIFCLFLDCDPEGCLQFFCLPSIKSETNCTCICFHLTLVTHLCCIH